MEAELDAELKAYTAMQEEAEQERDAVKKQEKLLLCRLKHKSLKQLLLNVNSVSKKLDVMVTFLSSMQSQLDGIETKLDAIQISVN